MQPGLLNCAGRLEAEEPDKFRPFVERGVISILAEPGVAAFLTLRR